MQTSRLVSKDQRERITKAVQDALSPLRPTPELRCSKWADEHFYLSPESSGSGTEGTFTAWPTQTAILDCMGSDRIPVVTFRKSAGIGYTKMLTAALGYFHHHKKRNTLTFQPTDEDAREFCKDTIDPMNRDVDVMGDLLRRSGKNNKENTLQTKHYLGSVLHVRGGTSANNYRRLRKDVVVYDELDGFDEDVQGEGDPVTLGDKRVRDSAYPKSIRGTTPTVWNKSQIQKSEESADVVLRYYVTCPECGHEQYFKWGGKDSKTDEIVPYGFKWHDNDSATTHYVCENCYDQWVYADLEGLLEGGRWMSEDGIWIDTDPELDEIVFRDANDRPVEYPYHVAFVTWAAYSLTFPWPVIVREFIDAAGDPVELKTWVNTTKGEYWKETVSSIEADPLYERREEYNTTDAIPNEIREITIGIDIGGDNVEYEIDGWGAGEENWALEYGVKIGDPTELQFWKELSKELKQKRYKRQDGRVLRIRIGIIDASYLTTEATKFSIIAGIKWIMPGRGQSQMGKPICVMPKRPNDNRVYMCQLGVDNAKETLYKRLTLEEPGPGYCHYPLKEEEFGEEYFYQLAGEEKRPAVKDGRKVLRFQQVASRVEALDCKVYNLAAIKILQSRFGVNLDVAGRPAPKPPEPPPDGEPPRPTRPRDDTPRRGVTMRDLRGRR